MTERIGVEITAKDGASKVFQEVSKSADKMGADIEKAGSRSSKAMAALQANAKQIGASLGIVASGLALAGRSAYNHQRELDALNRMYGESAQQLVSFSKEMENLTNVTDDQALVMANTMGTLVQNYGMSVEQIETLIQRTIDLAALKGKSFEEAAQMIQNAMRGEAEYAEQLGLTLNDRALGIDRLAKSTTDAEKAQIRFNAFLEQSAYSIGYAEEQTDGFYGAMYDLKGEIIDGAQALGEFMGPFGELGAFASQNAVQIAALTLVAGQLGSTLKATGLIGAVGGASGIAGTAGPILGVAAFAAGIYGAMELAWPDDEKGFELEKQAKSLASQVDVAMQVMQMSGDKTAASVGASTQQILTDSMTAIEQIELLNSRITSDQLALNTLNPGSEQYEQRSAQIKKDQADLALLTAQYGDWTGATEDQVSASQDLLSILLSEGPIRQQQISALEETNKQFLQGNLTFPQYVAGLDMVADMTGNVATKTSGMAKGMEAAGDAMTYQLGEATKLNEYYTEEIAKGQETIRHQLDLTRGAYTNVFEAMESGFRVAVGNTNAIMDQTEAIFKWADGLIAAEGVYSKLDDLVIAGRITGESGQFEGASQYAAAQRAYNSITEDRAKIEEHILTIQAKQAPLQALQVSMTEQRLAQISELQGQEQMLALAYMDQATSMKAMELAQGYVGNPEFFGPMIQQAAQYDQYLRELLVSMELIEVDREGNITLTGVEDSQSKLETLTTAIAALTQAQWIATFDGNIEQAKAAYNEVMGDANAWDNLTATATLDIQDNASFQLSNAIGLLNEFDGRNATAWITTIQQTLGDPFGTNRMLGGVAGYADGGVVIRAGEAGPERLDFPNGMHGLAVHDALYQVPVGTYVNTAPATETGIHGGIQVTVNISGVTDWDDAARQVSAKIVPAIQRAMRENERSLGGG